MASAGRDTPEQSRAVPSVPRQAKQAGPSEAEADDQCPICLDTMGNAACVPVCFHRFCLGCIRQWARENATCPLCRQPFDHLLRRGRAGDGSSTCHRQRNRERSRSPHRRPSDSRGSGEKAD